MRVRTGSVEPGPELLEFCGLLLTAHPQRIALLHDVGKQRMTVLQLTIQRGARVFGQLPGGLGASDLRFRCIESGRELLATPGQLRARRFQRGSFVSDSICQRMLGMDGGQPPQLARRLRDRTGHLRRWHCAVVSAIEYSCSD